MQVKVGHSESLQLVKGFWWWQKYLLERFFAALTQTVLSVSAYQGLVGGRDHLKSSSDINNAAGSRAKRKLQRVAAVVARLHLAPFVRKLPWRDLVSQQDGVGTAEGSRGWGGAAEEGQPGGGRPYEMIKSQNIGMRGL